MKRILVRVDMQWMKARLIFFVNYNGVTYTGMVVNGQIPVQHSNYHIYQIKPVKMIEGLTIQCLITLILEIL